MALDALQSQLPEELLTEPLEYIFADHFRQRTLCSVIDEIAETREINKELVAAVGQFLKSEFGLHILDEEEDLFPLLRKRAEPEDRIEQVLDDLCEEHASDKVDASEIIDLFAKVDSSGGKSRINQKSADLLKRFAANERQHLAVENAIVLPFARARLSDKDMRQLAERMAARRNISLEK